MAMGEAMLAEKELERSAQAVGIPSCPAVLLDLSAETKKEDPDLRKVEALVSKDMGLLATLLKTVNSPYYGLRSKVGTVRQAIQVIGISMLARTVTGIVLKKALSGNQPGMEAFWDASAKAAMVASFIAKQLPGMNKEEAYTFGLFQNCGIPILMQRFPDYRKTLAQAEGDAERKHTEVEEAAHGTDHATMGYLLTKSWNLPEDISQAIRYHHEYALVADAKAQLSTQSRNLMAMGLAADHALNMHAGSNVSVEWSKGGPYALAHLGLVKAEFDEIVSDLTVMLG